MIHVLWYPTPQYFFNLPVWNQYAETVLKIFFQQNFDGRTDRWMDGKNGASPSRAFIMLLYRKLQSDIHRIQHQPLSLDEHKSP